MKVFRLAPIGLVLVAGAYGQAPSSKEIPPTISASIFNAHSDARFDVVSVKPSDPNGGRGNSNVPLTAGERYSPNSGYFAARNQQLERYIAFAYDFDANPDPQLKTLPGWVNDERYDIEAKASHPLTKDEMRAMMRNLLADRFKLASHWEVRNMPVYTVTMVKPGKFGPQMREHVDEGMPCNDVPQSPAPAAARASAGGASAGGAATPPAAGAAAGAGGAAASGNGGRGARGGGGGGGGRGGRATPDGYPIGCGELASLPPTMPGRWRLAGRNITMDFFVVTLRGGMDRPVIDQTGLAGRYDWVMEYVPDAETDGQAGANFSNSQGDPTGPKMWTALPQQLGLKLSATKMDVQFLVFDHIERPTSN